MNKNKVLTIIACIVLAIIVIAIIIVKHGNIVDKRTNSKNPIIGNSNTNKTTNKVDEKIDYVEQISVYNAAEYMDQSTIKDFEKEYKIKVNYKEFESNESMYADFVKNSSKYDVLVPSDYIIDSLIKENICAFFFPLSVNWAYYGQGLKYSECISIN